MAARWLRRGRCGIVAIVAFAFAPQIAGCDARGDGTSVVLLDGGTGDSSGSTISCNPTGNGCLCIVDDSQPGQLTSCSPTSVAQDDTERGVCCVAQSLCVCTRYTCRSDPASSYCQCGSVATLVPGTLGTLVAECPAPTTGQHCCFSQDNASCTCARLACAAEETEVPSCSATAAGACPSGEDIAACR